MKHRLGRAAGIIVVGMAVASGGCRTPEAVPGSEAEASRKDLDQLREEAYAAQPHPAALFVAAGVARPATAGAEDRWWNVAGRRAGVRFTSPFHRAALRIVLTRLHDRRERRVVLGLLNRPGHAWGKEERDWFEGQGFRVVTVDRVPSETDPAPDYVVDLAWGDLFQADGRLAGRGEFVTAFALMTGDGKPLFREAYHRHYVCISEAILLRMMQGVLPLKSEKYQHLLAAVHKEADGDRAAALTLLSKSLAADPDFMPALRRRASLQQQMGRWEGVVGDLTALLRVLPTGDRTATLLERAVVNHHALGANEAALKDYDAVLKAKPGLVLALVMKGRILLTQGRIDDAAPCFEEALRLEPGSAIAQAGRAEVLAARRDHAAAVRAFDRALASCAADWFTGLGMHVTVDTKTDALVVAEVYDGGVAKRAGVVPGAVVRSVAGAAVDGPSFAAAVADLVDRNDTQVSISLDLPGRPKPLDLGLTREAIQSLALIRATERDLPHVLAARARSREALGATDAALADYKRALSIGTRAWRMPARRRRLDAIRKRIDALEDK